MSGISDSPEGSVGAVVTPSDFQTREVGVILQTCPEVIESGDISVLIYPEVVDDPELHTFENYSKAEGNDQVAGSQPFFTSLSLRSNVMLGDGERTILGVCPKAGNKEVTTVIIIGAMILN